MSATYKDRYGLPLSAQGQAAAEYYMEGIDCALALSVGAQASLEAAIAADPGFAMAHIALAREFQYRDNITAAQTSKAKALQCMDGVTRRERQHIEALAKGR
jgi:Tfp pilus assembly protein PilF